MIRLIETKRGQAILERTPRYDVMLNGELYGQLYFNMTGYTGCYLPTPSGIPLHIGEQSIAGIRREIARLNREWKAANATGT